MLAGRAVVGLEPKKTSFPPEQSLDSLREIFTKGFRFGGYFAGRKTSNKPMIERTAPLMSMYIDLSLGEPVNVSCNCEPKDSCAL